MDDVLAGARVVGGAAGVDGAGSVGSVGPGPADGAAGGPEHAPSTTSTSGIAAHTVIRVVTTS